ncbi:hypothetical protein D2T29_15865 [Sinirhodobacter populi]|uniref:Uncharacterized protein n=1 Tax=Paenirhodobacter populi TaxID=2306993 RepID=A0A443K7F1_9RHOB|nr:hypothetical protein [Sinirhodobacter populi]RWR28707.1 hypothetical protein D2T29_15865 [Sinirhodobacter populi]
MIRIISTCSAWLFGLPGLFGTCCEAVRFWGHHVLYRLALPDAVDGRAPFYPCEDWRASAMRADAIRRARQARAVNGRKVSGMTCSGNLAPPTLMLMG